jgi:hypothetical protein
LSATDQSPEVYDWICSWADKEVLLFKPEDWFKRGHYCVGGKMRADNFWIPEFKRGCYLWVPQPATADVALEEIRVARLKRQDSLHIIVVPRMMTPQWLRQLYKVLDIMFKLPLGSLSWPHAMYEPCMVGPTFPFLSVSPWQLRGTPKMCVVGRRLQGLLAEPDLDSGDIFRKLCKLAKRLQSVPLNVVRKLRYFR